MPSWAPLCLFGVCSISVQDAERLGGRGSGDFIGAEVDEEGGKGSGGTIEVYVETLLETTVSYIFTYMESDKQTHVHAYIAQIHKSVIKKVGCGINYDSTITSK